MTKKNTMEKIEEQGKLISDEFGKLHDLIEVLEEERDEALKAAEELRKGERVVDWTGEKGAKVSLVSGRVYVPRNKYIETLHRALNAEAGLRARDEKARKLERQRATAVEDRNKVIDENKELTEALRTLEDFKDELLKERAELTEELDQIKRRPTGWCSVAEALGFEAWTTKSLLQGIRDARAGIEEYESMYTMLGEALKLDKPFTQGDVQNAIEELKRSVAVPSSTLPGAYFIGGDAYVRRAAYRAVNESRRKLAEENEALRAELARAKRETPPTLTEFIKRFEELSEAMADIFGGMDE